MSIIGVSMVGFFVGVAATFLGALAGSQLYDWRRPSSVNGAIVIIVVTIGICASSWAWFSSWFWR